MVDDDIFEKVREYKFTLKSGKYVKFSKFSKSGYLHQLVMRLDGFCVDGLEIDHVDRNPLNNLRSNLRIASHYQNSLNRGTPKNNTTGYLGVRLDKRTGRYQAIHNSGEKIRKCYSIGYFSNIKDAALARDIWMSKNHPEEFLSKNFDDPSPEDVERVVGLMKNPKKIDGSSKYRGVRKIRDGIFSAQIAKDKKWHYLGHFTDEKLAAKAYDAKAKELFGPNAKINIYAKES